MFLCIRKTCIRRLPRCLALWGQNGQWNWGSFPHSYRMCSRRLCRYLYVLWQTRHRCVSPVEPVTNRIRTHYHYNGLAIQSALLQTRSTVELKRKASSGTLTCWSSDFEQCRRFTKNGDQISPLHKRSQRMQNWYLTKNKTKGEK